MLMINNNEQRTMKEEIKLRVWWKPQIPMNESFYVEVATPQEAKKVLDILAKYDLFQLENKIKPDFSNAGGLEVFESKQWSEWHSENGEDIDEVKF